MNYGRLCVNHAVCFQIITVVSVTEVIYDDRRISAGVMFSNADLIGVPFRVIVSPRNIKQNIVEIVSRDKSLSAYSFLAVIANKYPQSHHCHIFYKYRNC